MKKGGLIIFVVIWLALGFFATVANEAGNGEAEGTAGVEQVEGGH